MTRATTHGDSVMDMATARRYAPWVKWASGIFFGAILATATAVWAASKYVASQDDVAAVELSSKQRANANAGDIDAMKTEHQALREDVATTRADVGNLKDAARWQIKVILDLAKERRVPTAPTPDFVTAEPVAKGETP